MLVPAMAFAWWLVSVPAQASHPRPVIDESAPTAEATTEAQQQDTEDESAPSEPVTANEGSGETDESATGATGARVPVKLVTPEIVRVAKTFLDLPMGAERFVSIQGRRYVYVLERHYHPPGFVGGPHGWHKGVTVYELR